MNSVIAAEKPPTTRGSRIMAYILADTPHVFILLFLFVLSSISFYTTYDGLVRFSYGSFSQTPTVFIVVLFLFVMVLQGMLLFALFEMLRTRFLLKILWLIVYIVTMGVSVFFSYSFYYNLFRADSYAFDNFSAQIKQLKSSAGGYQNAFLQIKNDTEKLADYSRRRAEEERQKGGTCGYMSPPKQGPRSLYRDKEAKIFTALSSSISELYNDASTDIRKLEELTKSFSDEASETEDIQNQMNKVVQRINHYKTNGKILNLNETLRDHMYERRKTGGTDGLGYPITCPDENIDIKGTSIIKQIEGLPQVKEASLFNPNSDKEVLTRALTVFMQIPKMLFPQSLLDKIFAKKDKVEAEATKITSLDYSPLVLGGLIDLFIFIVGLADGLDNSKKHWKLKNFKGRYLGTADIPTMGEVANQMVFLGLLRDHVDRTRFGHRLTIPSSTNELNDDQRGILELVEAMEAIKLLDKPIKYNTTYEQLSVTAQTTLANVYDAADQRTYTVYKLPTRLWDELQQAYYGWYVERE